ncbi:13858_t:CDS:1, partial [Gigaspora margarita]
VSDLKDKLEQITLKPDLLSNDLKTNSDIVEKISNFSKTPFFLYYFEPKPNKSKAKDVVELLM